MNALSPIISKFSGKVNDTIPLPSKQFLAISLTFLGILKVFNAVHLSNAPPSNLTTLSGMVTDDSEVQPMKRLFETTVKELGNVTDVKLTQFQKQFFPILSTESGISTLSNARQRPKSAQLIVFNVLGSLTVFRFGYSFTPYI